MAHALALFQCTPSYFLSFPPPVRQTLIDICLLCCMQVCLEAGDKVRKYRYSVRGFAGDQGTERKLGDGPNIVANDLDTTRAKIAEFVAASGGSLTDASNLDQYLFPHALTMMGHLHAMFNSLEEAVCDMALWGDLDPLLKALVRFLGNRSMREQFVGCCLDRAPACVKKKFRQLQGRLLDWRWEHLEKAFHSLMEVLVALHSVKVYARLA